MRVREGLCAPPGAHAGRLEKLPGQGSSVTSTSPVRVPRMSFLRKIYWQVLIAIVLGIAFGILWPAQGAALKPLGDAFIALIRMMIGPVIFCTIVHGIGSMNDMAKVGRIGLKAIIWFEFISTFALILGLLAAHLLAPGVGMSSHVTPAGAKAVASFVSKASDDSVVAHL